MNVDFGIVSLFAIMVALVGMVYHAWRGIKSEISALEAHKDRYNACVTDIAALRAEIVALGKRMDGVSDLPKASLARIAALEEDGAATHKAVTRLDTLVVSAGARVSALQRWIKAAGNAEKDPAPEGEEAEGAMPLASPGSLPLFPQDEQPGLPPGFGVVSRPIRRAAHG